MAEINSCTLKIVYQHIYIYNVEFIAYIVYNILYCIQYTMYNGHTLYILHCSVYSIQCTMYIIYNTNMLNIIILLYIVNIMICIIIIVIIITIITILQIIIIRRHNITNVHCLEYNPEVSYLFNMIKTKGG